MVDYGSDKDILFTKLREGRKFRDKNIKKEVDMNSIGDIMKGGISAILIAVGYVVL